MADDSARTTPDPQITATLAHDFDSGSLTLYGRYINDKNQFITPIPLIQTGTDSFRAYPGFDPLTDTYYSEAIRHVRLPGYPNGGTNADLADGRGTKFRVTPYLNARGPPALNARNGGLPVDDARRG